jgi:hypothetical protein
MTASSSDVTFIHLTSVTHYFVSANVESALPMVSTTLITLRVPPNESTVLEQ